MAKTIFTDNVSKIYAAFANSIFGTGGSGGHVHDGVDNDGHCGKVDFFSHIANNVSSGYGVFGVKITTSYVTVEQVANIVYEKHQRLIIITVPQLVGISNSNALKIVPQSGDFPAQILPSGSSQVANVVLYDGGHIIPGKIYMTAYEWVFACLPAASEGVNLIFGNNNFGTSGEKGILQQTIMYSSEIV